MANGLSIKLFRFIFAPAVPKATAAPVQIFSEGAEGDSRRRIVGPFRWPALRPWLSKTPEPLSA